MRRFAALLFAALVLCSCSVIRNEASVANFLNEPIIAEHGAEHSFGEEFKRIISVISYNGVELASFSDPKTVSEQYRDRILSYLVNTGYSKYTGNSAKIKEAEKKYPKMRISVLVPIEDFEYMVYSNFGGAKNVSHRGDAVFTYLPKVEGYTAVGQVSASAATVELVNVKETQNTFIVSFYTCFGGTYSPLYRGVFVKREDGTVYLGKLDRVADAKITVPKGKGLQEK